MWWIIISITEILDQLGGAKYFSISDLASGFHEISMHESDAPKTAFTSHEYHEVNRILFRLKRPKDVSKTRGSGSIRPSR